MMTLRIADKSCYRSVMEHMAGLVKRGLEAGPVVITLGRDKRTSAQNKKMWPMLKDVSNQVVWHGQKLSSEDWKQIFSAAVEAQRAVPGIEGGFVVLGASTKNKDKEWFSMLFEVMYAFGAENGVVWSDEK